MIYDTVGLSPRRIYVALDPGDAAKVKELEDAELDKTCAAFRSSNLKGYERSIRMPHGTNLP